MKKISFYKRNGYIHCRVGGHRFTTKIKLPSGHTIGKGVVYGTNSASINAKIVEIKTIIMQKIKDGKPIVIENNFEVDELDPTIKDYARLVSRRISDDSILSKTGRPYSSGSKIQWRQFCNVLNRFDDTTKLLSLDMSGDAKQKKCASDLSKSYFQNLRSWMADQGFKITTQSMIFEKLKVLLAFAEDEFMIRVDKKFRHYKEEVPIVVISPDMVKKFLNTQRPADIRMAYAYEISSVVLVTSLRISDAMSLTIEDLSDGCIVSTNKKTGANTKSPIPQKVYQMLLDNYSKYGRIYSICVNRWETDAIMSEMMPLIFKDIATGNVTVSRMSPDGTSYTKTSKPLYEMIRPHMLRKSAITSMITLGVPERFVKHLSGHKGNSKAFERYVAYVEKEYNESIKNYQNNLIDG
jgi:integrase